MTTDTVDLNAIRSRAEFSTEPFHAEDVAELIAELEKVRAQLTAANHHADGLTADLRSAQQANTAYANENARLRTKLADAEATEPQGGCPYVRWEGVLRYRCGEGAASGECPEHGRFRRPTTNEAGVAR